MNMMDRERQLHLAEDFRTRHRTPHLLLLANAWDALSARIVEEAGFDAVATTSGGVNWVLGYADGEAAPWSEVVAATARMVRVLRVPLTADIEAGYGGTQAEVRRASATSSPQGRSASILRMGPAAKTHRYSGSMKRPRASARLVTLRARPQSLSSSMPGSISI
jgi:hypothetical protein